MVEQSLDDGGKQQGYAIVYEITTKPGYHQSPSYRFVLLVEQLAHWN